MRRLALLAGSLLLVDAPAALAAAGGGSSSYGGGGGGGGGGFGGGGSSGTGGTFSPVVFVIVVAVVLVVLAFGWIAERNRRRRRDARVRHVQLAAAEAAQDDHAFAVETVMDQAARLFTDIQAAWTARDRKALRALCGKDLIVEWERRLDDFAAKGWHNVVQVQGTPDIHYVGLVNREDDADDRVVVQIDARLTDYVNDRNGRRIKRSDSDDTDTTLHEYWTLSKRDGHWRLLSIEQLGEGAHHLTSELVASPWSDGRLREDAVLETAAADAAGDASEVAQLVDLDYAGDGHKAALDLSLVDGRFAPEVLETSARRAVEAWAEAVDGADDALVAIAHPDAVRALLYPRGGDTVRRVVRGPKVAKMTLVALDGQADPPTMVVELELSGRRYLENRDTIAVVEGSRDSETRWTERWTFALDGEASAPWIVASAGDAPITT